jgi:hypothetical protein
VEQQVAVGQGRADAARRGRSLTPAFSLDRQSLAFLIVIAVLAITMLFLAPFALMVLCGVGVLLLLGLWFRAAIRARSLVGRFGPIEGAIALSSLLLVIGGAAVSGWMVARLGLGEAVSLGGAMLPSVNPSGPRVGWRSVWYSNADTQQRLKDGLAKAGIPFRTRMEGGKEYVSWAPEHDAAAEKISEEARAGDVVPPKRGIAFGTAETQREFTAWLDQRGVKWAIVPRDGKDFVEWEDKASTSEIVEAFMKQRSTDCEGAKAKAKC